MIELIKKNNFYLSFHLGNEIYAIEVYNVIEILEKQNIIKVPKSPAHIKGIINRRGDIIPLIDTKIILTGNATSDDEVHEVLVLNVESPDKNYLIGAQIGSAKEVFEIQPNKIQPIPDITNRYNAEFYKGMVKTDSQFIMILDSNSLFSLNNLMAIKNITK